MSARTVDAVVAGAGMAGLVVAAALGDLGWDVVLVEPGLDPTKRLAGELIHPPGVRDLEDLNLQDAFEGSAATAVLGFAVLPDANASAHLLPYGEVPGVGHHGYTVDHSRLTARLLAMVSARPHVTSWIGGRVTALDLSPRDFASVTVADADGEHAIRARLVVAADGASSVVRRLGGLRAVRVRLSHMTGYVVRGATLPYPGYGNVFLGGPAPALAYAIGPDAVRIMFDVPDNPDGVDAPRRSHDYLAALPEAFRERVRLAMDAPGRLVSVNATVVPEAVAHGRLVLAGDAAGCCHPLTATGLSACTRDAIRLRRALQESGGDVVDAGRLYARFRGGAQATRMALAEALYAAFAGRSPEMRLLRAGILRYWARSRRGRAASLALLSTHEGRMSRLALAHARAVGYALTALARPRGDEVSRSRAAWRLGQDTLRYAYAAVRGVRPGGV